MGDRPRHATWQVTHDWRVGAVLTAVWVGLAWIRWAAYSSGPTTWRLVLAVLSTTVAVAYLAGVSVLWWRTRKLDRPPQPAREPTGRHSRRR